MKQFLPEAKVRKLLLDSAHDTMPYYEYCRSHDIVPFIDLNADRGRPPIYKGDININNDGALYAGKGMPCAGTAPNPRKEGQNSNVPKSALPAAG